MLNSNNLINLHNHQSTDNQRFDQQPANQSNNQLPSTSQIPNALSIPNFLNMGTTFPPIEIETQLCQRSLNNL